MSLLSDMRVIQKTDLVWRALSEPIRREILDCLATEPHTTGQLVERFPDLCRTGVMKHLDVLVEANLVIVEKSGRTRWNHLNPIPLEEVCQRWLNERTRSRAKALCRLKNLIESRDS